jgi:hypothetical protein
MPPMTALLRAFCEFCQEHFVRAGVRTGDLHTEACGCEVVVEGPWSGWAVDSAPQTGSVEPISHWV